MTAHTPTVVVGVDGSEEATRAAHAAAAEASRRRWPLRLIRAFSWTDQPLPGFPDPLAARSSARHSANAALDRLRRELGRDVPDWTISSLLVEGRPETALCLAVQAGDLLVVGASGLTWGAGSGVLGTVAEAVAASAPCPVLVHRDIPALEWRRAGVVAGVDGGPGSPAVLRVAADEALARGTGLAVVHAWPQLAGDAVQPLRWRMDPVASQASAEAAARSLVTDLRTTRPTVDVSCVVAPGRPGRVLVDAGRAATLLVVGRRDLLQGGPGAVVHSVLHQADLPVLVVPVPSAVDVDPVRRPETAAVR